ncbi:MAG: glutaminase [Solirubrobacteraceae bacterium]|jgi:glutaminase
MHNFQKVLNEIYNEIAPFECNGKVANYIPELAKINPKKFGITIFTLNKECFSIGQSSETFSIQSISKVLSLTLAIQAIGKSIWNRVNIEPSGDSFNSLILLESENGIPRNPFINSGAIVVADIILSHYKNPKQYFLEFVRSITKNNTIEYNQAVIKSEKAYGYRNLALAYLMKSFGNIKNNVEEVVDLYIHFCGLAMSCEDLSKAFMVFANNGKNIFNNQEVLSPSRIKRINAIMQTCGFYDQSGKFAFEVGLPGKSGVGGGIIAIHPNKYSVAVWSPKLNENGNSVLGMVALEKLTTKLNLSIF